MPSIQAPAISGALISNTRIFSRVSTPSVSQTASLPRAADPVPEDRFVQSTAPILPRNAPVIRSLDASKLPPTTPALLRQSGDSTPKLRLTREQLVQALDRSGGQVNEGPRQIPAGLESLTQAVSRIRGDSSSVRLESPTASERPQSAPEVTGPRVDALREHIRERLGAALGRFEQRLAGSDSSRLQRLHGLLAEGLASVAQAAVATEPISPQQRAQGALALTLCQALSHLTSQGSEQEQAVKLQQWALMVDESSQSGALTPRMMLEAAASLLAEGAQQLQSETAQVMRLLGEGPDLLDEPLPPAGREALQLMQEMTPAELSVLGSASRELSITLLRDVLSIFDVLTAEIKAQRAESAKLDAKTLELIAKADELALRMLMPVPEAPNGFEDGVLSLLREFRKIIEALDIDMRAVQAQETALILERRKLDSQFLVKLLGDRQYHSSVQQQRDSQLDQVKQRYDQLAQRLTQSAQLV
ncbi:MAG: hypothetical protein CVV27_08290 [Candidatus Melainabacteria bacterium HGW-Melainabacteria-1]|nr:MAG: hypothetical protein CVV27_08290 [Candidatus Melainabacteria bacterium HGW-Melainabacteria-1]